MTRPMVLPPSRPWIVPVPPVARRLSLLLIPLVILAAGVGLLLPGVYRDNPQSIPLERANDLANLAVAIPLLIGSLMLAAHDSLRGYLLWMGTLGWLIYVGAIDSFGLQFNPLFLVYVAILGLATYALILGLGAIHPRAVARSFDRETPTRWIGGYLIAASVLTALLWLSDIVPAMLGGHPPQAIAGRSLPVEPTHVLDLGLLLPTSILAGVLVIRHHPWGYVLTGVCLALLNPLLVAVNLAPIFQLAAGQPIAVGPVVSYAIILVANLGFTGLYLKAARLRSVRE